MVYYDVIPLLTLSSSCLNLLCNIIEKLYRFSDHDSKLFSDKDDKNDKSILDAAPLMKKV